MDTRTYTVQRHLRHGGRIYFSSRTSPQEAIVKLNTLQSNAATLEAMRASGAGPKADYAILEMVEYIKRIGYTVRALSTLLSAFDMRLICAILQA